MKSLAAAFVITVLVAHAAHGRLTSTPLPTPPTLEEVLPSHRALELTALGYRSLVADYYWLRALSDFGNVAMVRARYPNLIALVRRVLALDPYFATAYYFAGTALTVKELDPKPSIDLLEQGMRYRPDDWRIPLLLGFNSFYFEHDYVRGAEALAEAAKHPDAPDWAGPLATRLAAASDAPEVGLALVDSILPSLTDEKLRETYLERRRLLELEVDLAALNHASRRFREEHGRPPAAIRDLVEDGLVRELPAEPLGGRFFVAADGEVKTTNDGRRLRLHVPAATEPPR